MKNSKISFEDTYELHNHYKNFSLPKCMEYLERQGKEQYGPVFTLKNEHFLPVQKTISFAIQDEKCSKALGIDLSKGLLLSGPEGVGKTACCPMHKARTKKRKGSLSASRCKRRKERACNSIRTRLSV